MSLQLLVLLMAPKSVVLKKQAGKPAGKPAAKPAGKLKKEPAVKVEEEKEPEDEEEDEEEEEEEEEQEEEDEEEEAVVAPSPKRSPKRLSTKSSSSDAVALSHSPLPNKRGASSSLQVDYTITGSLHSPLAEGLVQLRRKLHRCDAAIVAGAGARIPVHAVVLASQSPVLDRKLEEGGPEVELGNVSHDAADYLVRWMYGEIGVDAYTPATPKVNEEVLRLASELALPLLAQICSTRLAMDVSIKNVVERIQLCESFGLPELRAALVSALVEDRSALDAVARDDATLSHPALMRELLAALAAKAIEEQQGGPSAAKGDTEAASGSRPLKQQRVA